MLRPGGEQLLGSTDVRTLGIAVRFLDLVPVRVGSDAGK